MERGSALCGGSGDRVYFCEPDASMALRRAPGRADAHPPGPAQSSKRCANGSGSA
ncbi:hypothetical protein KSP39_PZI020342 [Platanthera zijinensis]|uniref:Uncharacterized protein n=1 Tax=Platanthera zijinensis TaxID=2320716 RepID=A0AAP0AZI8_9ASPA